MATFTEVSVQLQVTLRRAGADQRCLLSGQSLTADGKVMRTVTEQDVTSALNEQQVTEALDLLNAAEAYLKTLWDIT